MYKKIHVPIWVWYDSFEVGKEAYTDKSLAQVEINRLNEEISKSKNLRGDWYLEEIELIE